MEVFDESELVESMAKSLTSRPGFEGAVIYLREKRTKPNGDITTQWGMATPKGATASQTRKILEGVLGPLASPESLSTEALINELLSRPGFRGIVAQELGYEGREVVGRTEIRSHVPGTITVKDGVEILQKAAAGLSRRSE